jgi:hypothetical protein
MCRILGTILRIKEEHGLSVLENMALGECLGLDELNYRKLKKTAQGEAL